MDWRLGLDIGTNSIGWAVLIPNGNDHFSVKDIGVRIFSDGREPSQAGRVGDPKALTRRRARQMRRRIERVKRRKKAVAKLLKKEGFLPTSEVDRLKVDSLNPYELRACAAHDRISPFQLGRVLMHLSVRRGYKSNRKNQVGDEGLDEKRVTSVKINKLTSTLGGRTLGEFLYEMNKDSKPIRFTPDHSEFYPSRAMYIEEFARIRSIQERYYPKLDWDRLHHILFDQRPLKRPERGHCRYYPEEYRSYNAVPSAIRFRIMGDLSRLSWSTPDGSKGKLDNEHIKLLFSKLEHQKELSFDKAKGLLGLPQCAIFNLQSERFPKLKGNDTCCDLRSPERFGALWDEIPESEQDAIVELLITEDDPSVIAEALAPYSLHQESVANICAYSPRSGVSALSSKFMRQCYKLMLNEHLDYTKATERLGFHHSIDEKLEQLNELPYYGKILHESTIGANPEASEDNPEIRYGRIGNPTVHVALNQVMKLVNALIKRYGNPHEVVIEVGRELKLSKEERDAITKDQTKRKKENDRIKNEYRGLGWKDDHVTNQDIKKFKLWEELGKDSLSRCCIYCGEQISASQLVNGEAQIEHILPFSRTFDDSMGNLTVAHQTCNAKKGNRTPYEAFHAEKGKFAIESIRERAYRVFRQAKAKRFNEDAIKLYEKDDNFIARQLTDNAYIARIARDYLKAISPKVWNIPGRLTALFRAQWGFNTILGNKGEWFKNRFDHRHHAIDAVTIGLIDNTLLMKAASENSRSIKPIAPPCPVDREGLSVLVSETLVSVKPDHGIQGKLFAETALGRIKRLEWIATSALKVGQVDSIGDAKIRRSLVSLMEEMSFAKALDKVAETHERIPVFMDRFVATMQIHELTPKDIFEFHRIIDRGIENRIVEHLAAYGIHDATIKDAKELEKALRQFSEKSGIKRIRYQPKDQTPIIIKSAPFKAYMPGDYLFVDIWMINDPKRGKKRYEGVFVTRAQANQKGFVAPRPHPAAKKLMRLYKNDVIFIDEGDGSYPAVVAGYAATQNKIDIQPLHASDTISSWIKNTNPHMLNGPWKQVDGQNFISINALFQRARISQVKISIEGKIKRR
jgi:CRISPR-associated endonuclease Csn1